MEAIPRQQDDLRQAHGHIESRRPEAGQDHHPIQLTLTGIPLEAYDYIVNGKPALEWIMERYHLTIDKASGITNDPNDWCREHDNPRYIVDIIKRVTRVSLETMKIVNAHPALNER